MTTKLPVDPLAQKLMNSKYFHWAPTSPDLVNLDPIVYYPAEFEAFRIHFKELVRPGDLDTLIKTFKFLVRCFRTMVADGEYDTLGPALPALFRRFEKSKKLDEYFPQIEIPPSPIGWVLLKLSLTSTLMLRMISRMRRFLSRSLHPTLLNIRFLLTLQTWSPPRGLGWMYWKTVLTFLRVLYRVNLKGYLRL